MPVLFQLKDHFKENQLFLNRTVTATVVVIILLVVLLSRLAYLQIYNHDRYATLARNNQVRLLSIAPTRGLIYDRNGALLAENIPNFSLEIIPGRVKQLPKLLNDLKKTIKITDSDLKRFHKQRRLKGSFEGIPIRTKLTETEVAKFSIEKFHFPEVEVVAHLSRRYPQGQALAHVLGYIGSMSEDDLKSISLSNYRGTHYIGKSGIEKFYENSLHGTVGYQQVETDARGRIIRTLTTTFPKPGQNLHLTIDSQLQAIAYEALGEQVGAAVVIEPNTGEILALVSKPSFNPNLFVDGMEQSVYQQFAKSQKHPLFNRAIRGQYAPGSTVKPLVALQALENQLITPATRIFDPGYYKLREEGRLFRDWKATGHGFINLEHAIAESCTTFFYYLSDKLGIDKIHDVYTKFGLGQPTGVNLDGEAAGLAPSTSWKRKVKKDNWYPGETLITGIGQGYTLVTPLQIASMISTIANRGKKIQPTLLKSDNTDKITENIRLNAKRNWDTIIRGMELTTKDTKGTAFRVFHRSPYSVAGKTGTAQVFAIGQDETYDEEKINKNLYDHGWFMAFAPIEKPQIALAVLIEHGKGGSLAAKKIIDAYFANKKGTS